MVAHRIGYHVGSQHLTVENWTRNSPHVSSVSGAHVGEMVVNDDDNDDDDDDVPIVAFVGVLGSTAAEEETNGSVGTTVA